MTFNWINFDNTFILDIILASDLPETDKKMAQEYSQDKEYLVATLNTISKAPDKQFILKYRTIIEQKVLKYQKSVVSKICKALNIHGISHIERQTQMTKKPTSASLIQAYINALYDISGFETALNEYSKFKSTIALNMKETITEDVPLYDFQKDVISKLTNYYITNDGKSGIMVMPTGSGKSRTATYFLIKEMISQGYQILWIAHRHMLIDQAADCFYKFAGLAKLKNPGIKNYNISCISGEHMNIRQAGKSEVIVASVASICRNKEHLRRILSSKVMIVVDEAHHTLAPTYTDTIRYIQKSRKNTKLLGLTATPIRNTENNTARLMDIYGDNILCNITMSDLIAKGILADPHFRRVHTDENFEPEITLDEEKLLKKYGELPESLVNKIASSNSRNKIILDTYLENKEKYGKTLIFAMNILHCRFLYDELIKAGIKAGLVYSGKEDNSHIINLFKENKLDVLVNVNIMTEGSDVPNIQTVFLTKPSSSEGLIMQMIGRGMRGIHAHGTETVNIVDFYDNWTTFNKWLNPEWLILDEKDETDKIPEYVKKQKNYIEYEWSLCCEIYNSIKFSESNTNTILTLPVGWYTLIDKDGELKRMLVFENQVQSFIRITQDRRSWKNDLSITPYDMLKKYFGGFSFSPSVYEMELFMDNVRNLEIAPSMHKLINRKQIDPYYVTQNMNESQDIFEYAEKLFNENSLVRDLYPDKETYTMELCKAKVYKNKKHFLGLKVEELPIELVPFDKTPYYDLEFLTQAVKNEMFGGTFEGISSIEWTDKIYSTYYGLHIERDGIRNIKINKILNSKDVPEEVVKFVIYHELLHRDNMSHDALFKAEERKYPGYEHCEHFLFNNMYNFDIHTM